MNKGFHILVNKDACLVVPMRPVRHKTAACSTLCQRSPRLWNTSGKIRVPAFSHNRNCLSFSESRRIFQSNKSLCNSSNARQWHSQITQRMFVVLPSFSLYCLWQVWWVSYCAISTMCRRLCVRTNVLITCSILVIVLKIFIYQDMKTFIHHIMVAL